MYGEIMANKKHGNKNTTALPSAGAIFCQNGGTSVQASSGTVSVGVSLAASGSVPSKKSAGNSAINSLAGSFSVSVSYTHQTMQTILHE